MSFMNQFKTVILLALLTALLLWVGQMIGGPTGLIIGLVFALVMNFGSYWFSDKIVLSMYGAKEADRSKYSTLYNIVEDVSMRAKLPVPKVYVLPQMTPNAFATGRNPKHSAVAFTEGIMQLLDKEELKGVVAHELSHIKNRDTLIATIAATIAGVISYIATMAQWAAIFGGFGGNNDDDGGNAIQLLVLAILTPIVATIIQMAISRSREYQADESAAKMLQNRHGLIGALQKLERGVQHRPLHSDQKTGASLFIVNPFTAKGLISLFSTHPTVKDRVNKLKKVEY